MAQLGSSKVFGNLQVTGNIVAGTTITGTTLSISGTATAVTFSGALSGNATTATTLQTARTINLVSFNGSQNITLTKLYSIDDRTLAPADTNTRYLEFGFGAWNNNNTGPFADFLNMRSYSDSSGGNDNVLMLRKDAIGMRIYQQSFGSTTAYASYRDVAFTDSPTFTGQVTIATGTSIAPAILSSGDADTGIYFPSAGRMSLVSNGLDSVYLHSNTNVGIGHNAPTSKLDVAGTLSARGAASTGAILTVTPDATSGTFGTQIENSFVSGGYGPLYILNGGATRLTLATSGNVGIGTTSPLAKLDSAGNIKITNNSPALLATTTDGRGWRIGNSSNGTSLGTFYIQGTTDNFSTSFIDSFFISPAGNVGIGTANPTTKLEVAGGVSLSGTLTFNGSTGSSGQVLTSQGSSAPIWSSAGTGTVTSVAMTVPAILSVSGTPVTTSGTFAVSLANQNANLVFAGPTTGAATTPTFRGLVLADIPDLGSSYLKLSGGTLTGQLVISSGGASIGSDITINGLTVGRGGGSISTNTALGFGVLSSSSSSNYNVAIGYNVLNGATNPYGNSAIGYGAMLNGRSGQYNVAMGMYSLYSTSSGNNNIGLGYQSLYGNSLGSFNIAIGTDSMNSNNTNTSSYNIAIGSSTMIFQNSATQNIAIGNQAMRSNSLGSNSIGIGYQSMYLISAATDSIAIGASAGYGSFATTRNTAIGTRSLTAITTGTDNTGIGYESLKNITTGSSNIGIGTNALFGSTAASNNIAIGKSALYSTSNTVSNLVAIGQSTLALNTTGTDNTAIGDQALSANLDGYSNIAIGNSALKANTSGYFNIAIGRQALTGNTSGANIIAIGGNAVSSGSNSGSQLIAIGSNVLSANTTGTNNIGLGLNTLQNSTTGTNNIGIGNSALNQNKTASYNTAIGDGALFYHTTGNNNMGIGYNALLRSSANINCTAIGHSALANASCAVNTFGTITGGSGYVAGTYNNVTMTLSSGTAPLTYPVANITVGAGGTVTAVTLVSGGSRIDLTTVLTAPAASLGGAGSGFQVPVASILNPWANVAVGEDTLLGNTTGRNNTGIGYRAGSTNQIGDNNTSVGRDSLYGATNASGSVAVGYAAVGANTNRSSNLTAIGTESIYANTTGGSNSALGYRSLYNNTTGSNNTAIGYQAGFNVTTGSSNTIIGMLAGTTNISNTVLIGAGSTERLKVDSTGLYVNQSTNNLNDALAIAWLGL